MQESDKQVTQKTVKQFVRKSFFYTILREVDYYIPDDTDKEFVELLH